MPYIMNALPTPVNVKAFGNWYSFTPGQIKLIHNENVAFFLMEKRGEDGLVGISEGEMEWKTENPEAHRQAIETKRIEGINKRLEKLEWVKQNLMSSLSKDLKQTNNSTEALVFASKGEKEALKELKSLRAEAAKVEGGGIEDLKKLVQELDSGDSQ